MNSNANPLAPYPPPKDLFGTAPIRRFTLPLMIEYAEGPSQALHRDLWRVTAGFAFYVGPKTDNTWVYVPAGYLTDGATVPRLFWDLIPPWGHYGQAAVLHDLLCEYLTVFKDGQPVRITRAQADDILHDALKVCGVKPLTRWAIYTAVRAYAFFAKPDAPQARHDKRALEEHWQLQTT